MKYIRQAGQWFFLRLEKVFNAVFGDRLNPLYHLGAIAYLMTWVAVASGIYMYAFFDTGVKEAYDSVDRVTHGHFYLGQIMRGLHRYASDGMVFAMGLHMLRHFVFDHYRGFRWFSWVTGVVVKAEGGGLVWEGGLGTRGVEVTCPMVVLIQTPQSALPGGRVGRRPAVPPGEGRRGWSKRIWPRDRGA